MLFACLDFSNRRLLQPLKIVVHPSSAKPPGLALLEIVQTEMVRLHQAALFLSKAATALSKMALNVASSVTARSASALRSISILAAANPSIKRL